MQLEITPEAAAEVIRHGGVIAIDYIPPIAWGGTPQVSVDTYLKRKNLSRYNRETRDGVDVLIAPFLVQATRRITLDYRRRFLRRTRDVEVEPRWDHFHGPACRR
jgi:hypothetical protein